MLITVNKLMQGDGYLDDLLDVALKAKQGGAIKYHVHVQYTEGVGAYVQMIEFLRVKPQIEILMEESESLKKKIEEINQNILKLKQEKK